MSVHVMIPSEITVRDIQFRADLYQGPQFLFGESCGLTLSICFRTAKNVDRLTDLSGVPGETRQTETIKETVVQNVFRLRGYGE